MALVTHGKSKDRELALESLRDLLVKETFQEELLCIRQKFAIPEDGYPLDWGDDPYPQAPPLQWHGICGGVPGFENENIGFAIKDAVVSLFGKYGFCGAGALSYDPLEFFVFYNQLPDGRETYLQYLTGACFLEDVTIGSMDSEGCIRVKDQNFPIVLRISPNASQRGLVDFIQKNWDTIKVFQERHKKATALVGKSRRKRNPERDLFIYDNLGLTWKELKRFGQKSSG